MFTHGPLMIYHSTIQTDPVQHGITLSKPPKRDPSKLPHQPSRDKKLPASPVNIPQTPGREGIEASEGGAMLLPLVSGFRAQESPIFLRGLTCAIALARRGAHGPPPGSTTTAAAIREGRGGPGPLPPTAPSGLSLPNPGGVGLSGPAKPHPLDLEGKLYNDLVDLLDAPPPDPLEGVRGLVRMGFLEAVMRFLVREDEEDGDGGKDDGISSAVSGVRGGGSQGARGGESREVRGGESRESKSGSRDGTLGRRGGAGRRQKPKFRVRGPYYFSLKQRHACLGAVALHGLVVLVGPHPAIFTGQTLRYLCYSIQVAYIDLTVGRLAPGMGYPLLFRSIQLACRALAFLAQSDDARAPSLTAQGKGRKDNGETVDGDTADDGQVEEDRGEGGAEYHGSLRRVVDSLFSTTAMKEVACMAQMPSRTAWVEDDGGYMFRQLERTVSSAAVLIAGVCPVPAGERDPFVRWGYSARTYATIEVYLFMAKVVFVRRSSLTQNRRGKNAIFFLYDSRCVPRPWDFSAGI